MKHSNSAVKTALDIQVDGKLGLERPEMTWQQLTERDCREWKLRAIDPHDRLTWTSCIRDLPCMQQASYLEGVPLKWMLPLYLHVNQKSDDPDDDDEQHHWYIVKMLNHNVLHNIAFLTSLQELNRYRMNSVYYHRIIRFLINMKVQGQHPHPLPGSWLAARMADLIQDLQVCLS